MFRIIQQRLKTGIVTKSLAECSAGASPEIAAVGAELHAKIKKLFGRSLAVREVDAGSCNACELELIALSNPVYDIERFGIHVVASPRHADVLFVTGPVTRNMETALKKTYEATPAPKLVIGIGDCAACGGVYKGSYAVAGGVGDVVPVDMIIPGCPPRPIDILHALLKALK